MLAFAHLLDLPRHLRRQRNGKRCRGTRHALKDQRCYLLLHSNRYGSAVKSPLKIGDRVGRDALHPAQVLDRASA